MAGYVPWWWSTVKAARYLGCPPWELEEGYSRLVWRMIANESELAELKWRAPRVEGA